MLPYASPPNREWYLDRCAALARTVNKPEIFPPFLVASYCQSVLVRIYGSPWRVIWLLLQDRLRHDWEHFTFTLWESWHKNIRLRTHEEFMEIYEKWIEKTTGYDCREWPDEISIDDEVEQHSV